MSQKVAVGTVYVAAMFMSIMDATIVNVALPAIGRAFSAPPTGVASISIAYLVSLGAFIPASGWLGDRFGGKRVLLIATAVFTLSSALCGLATSLPELVAFRVLQGAGGGMLAPVGLAMLFRVFPLQERIRAAAILTVPTTLAPAAGPVLGGLLVTELSWRWVFYVNVPIGAAAIIFGLLFVRQPAQDRPGRFDLIGFLLSGAGLGSLMYGVSEGPNIGWGRPEVIGTIVAGALLLTAMTIVELRLPGPLVALGLFRNRLFRSATGALSLAGVGFIGTLFVTSLYLQDGRGLDALVTGLSIFPEALGVMAGAQLASRLLYPSLGPRRQISLGLAGAAVSMALLAALGDHTSLWWARLIMFALGVSMGQIFVPSQAAGFATIDPAGTSAASTLFNTARQLSGAVGVAILTSVIVAVGPVHAVAGRLEPDLNAYRVAFLVAAVIGLAGLVPALAIRDQDAVSTIPDGRYRRRHVAAAGLAATGLAATGAAAVGPEATEPGPAGTAEQIA
jgi:EmrB/QacA subfamily drug resistance transporter